MEHIGCIVKNGGTGEPNHRHREENSELKFENNGSDNQDQRNDKAPPQQTSEKREIFARDKGNSGEPAKAKQCY